jgi:hypothetical protein
MMRDMRTAVSNVGVDLPSNCVYSCLQIIVVANIGHCLRDIPTKIETPAAVLGVERNSVVPEAACNVIDLYRLPHRLACDTSHIGGDSVILWDCVLEIVGWVLSDVKLSVWRLI